MEKSSNPNKAWPRPEMVNAGSNGKRWLGVYSCGSIMQRKSASSKQERLSRRKTRPSFDGPSLINLTHGCSAHWIRVSSGRLRRRSVLSVPAPDTQMKVIVGLHRGLSIEVRKCIIQGVKYRGTGGI